MLIGIFFSINLLADPVENHQLLIGLSAGPTWTSGNKTQTFNLQPEVEKTYTADHNSSVFPSVELFIGWQKPLSLQLIVQSLMGQLGFALAGAGNAKLTGDIWEDADPDFNNYAYNYKVSHLHAAVKGRLIGHCNRLFEPYISGGIGVGFNRAYDFTINPKIVEEVAAPPFKSHTTTTFIYSLGLGIQTNLNSNLQAAIGYEFSDWGKTKLARASGQTQNQGLALNHLYAQQIQLSLFYIV